MSERPTTLLDALVDLAVYAPVGLALTAAEELPGLIAKGRSRIEPQVGTARLVGQFVVAEGWRRVGGLGGLGGLAGFGGPTTRPRPSDGAPAGTGPAESATRDAEAASASDAPGASDAPRGAKAAGASKATKRSAGRAAGSKRSEASADMGSGDVESLAIPGYDSLSASQVVQRLAGLSSDELAAVGRYEAANRGRRTILTRVAQLQGS